MKRIRIPALAFTFAALAGACTDSPTDPTIAAGHLTPALATYASPTVTVTRSGSYPLVSWSALAGATSYTVTLITYYTVNGQYQNRRFQTLATTTATSYLDAGHSWTGAYECSSDGWGIDRSTTTGQWYEYAVQANYPNGSSPIDNARHYAPIARPGCFGIL